MGEIIPIPYVCGFLNTLHQNVLNFFKKSLLPSIFLYFCIAVPGVPLPDIQMLVMNPGFLLPFCVCKNNNYPFAIT